MSHSRTGQCRPIAMLALLCGVSHLAMAATAFAAGPEGASVVQGTVSVTSGATNTIINQTSNRALVDWRSFDTDAGHRVDVIQPDRQSLLVNRVKGNGAATRFDGDLNANGQVFLLNEAGIFIGANARINAAGFLATTSGIDETSLNGSNIRFTAPGLTDAIVANAGVIRVADGGYAALAGAVVRNEGLIEARLGRVTLAGSDRFEIDMAGDGLIRFALDSEATGKVLNGGVVRAAGGTVLLTARAGRDAMAGVINSTGVVEAQTAVERDGRIIITGDAQTDISLSGTLDASGQATGQKGGSIDVTGRKVTLADARVNADGDAGGGVIRLGGDERGSGDMPHADRVAIDKTSLISADATGNGDGGKVVVWSETHTAVTGTLTARGGAMGGDGGMVEVSSKGGLYLTGRIWLEAPKGTNGLFILDPQNIYIDDEADLPVLTGDDEGVSVETIESITAGRAEYFAFEGNIYIGDIADGSIDMQPDVTLRLYAGDGVEGYGPQQIVFSSPTTINLSGTGGLDLSAPGEIVGDFTINGASGNIMVRSGAGLETTGTITSTGNISLEVQDDLNIRHTVSTTGKLTLSGNNIAQETGALLTAGDLSISAYGEVLLTETGNSIRRISSLYADTNADIRISAGDVVLGKTEGDFSNISAGDDLTIIVGNGNLSLAEGLLITSGHDIVLASSGNVSIAGDVELLADNRFLIYARSQGGSDLGPITVDDTLTGYNFTSTPPSSITEPGNIVIYNVVGTLTVKADDIRITYGATPSYTYSVTGFVGSDTAGNTLTGTASLSSSAGANPGVGTYTITTSAGSLATTKSYDFEFVAGTLTIDPATLTLIVNSTNRTYGQANPAFTYDISGLVNGDSASVVSGVTFTSATQASGVGTYAITASGGTAANYAIQYQAGSLTIDPATLTVQVNNANRTYGQANPAFTYDISGLVNGDSASVVSGVTFNTDATQASGVGTYAVTASGGTAANYTIQYQAGSLTIDPAALTIQVNNTRRTYGQANPTFTYDVAGLVNGDSASVVSGVAFNTGATQASGVGIYAVTASGGTAANYTIQYQAGSLSIDPAALTLQINNANRTYGQANPAFAYEVSGLVNGDSASVVSGVAFNTSATQASGIGTYAVTASGGTAANYTIQYQAGTLTIDPASLTLQVNNSRRTYGQANPAFAYDVSGLVNGDSASVVSGVAFNTSATQASGVGTYAVTASGGTAANYTIQYQAGSLSIDPASLTLQVNNTRRTYGQANPAFAYDLSGLVNGDSASVVSGVAFNTSATQASGVGTYAVTASGGTAANYTIQYQAGILTIDPAALTLQVNNSRRTYGQDNPALAYEVSGLVNGDSASVVSGVTFNTSATQASGVGTYAVTASGGTAANYTIQYQAGTLTIDPASLTLQVNNTRRTYGQANPAFTYDLSGLVNGDSASVVSGVAFNTSATQASGVGTYAITASGGTAANYTIQYQAGTLTIDPAALTLQVNNSRRTYGQANPAFAYDVAGLVNGDSASVVSGVAFNTSATQASGVGTYAITASGGTAANYTIQYQAGTLTIDPAALTLQVNNSRRTYGQANPAFAYDVAGLVNGDSASVVSGVAFNTSATQASGVGTYAVTASGGTAANYTIQYQAGSLTIDPAALTLQVNNTRRTYGQANPTFTYDVSGFVNGDTASVVSDVTFNTGATQASGVGTYAVTASGGTAANYTIQYQAGSLTIDPATLTVRINDASRSIGAENPVFSAQYEGLVNGDSGNVVTGLAFSTSATSASPTGAYAITGSGGTAANYVVTIVAGTLTILPATTLPPVTGGGESVPPITVVNVIAQPRQPVISTPTATAPVSLGTTAPSASTTVEPSTATTAANSPPTSQQVAAVATGASATSSSASGPASGTEGNTSPADTETVAAIVAAEPPPASGRATDSATVPEVIIPGLLSLQTVRTPAVSSSGQPVDQNYPAMGRAW